VIAQAVMASFMTIIGVSMIEHGHGLLQVTVTMSAHFIGMFGLVLVVGRVVERIGRGRAMVSGLVILTCGLLGLAVSAEMYAVMPSMFVIGVGWNLAFVASTVVLADAARPSERAGLLGFNDFAAVGLAAPGVVFAAILLGEAGLTTLVLAGAAIALTPLPVLLARPRARGAAARA
jgi:MFS family permease